MNLVNVIIALQSLLYPEFPHETSFHLRNPFLS